MELRDTRYVKTPDGVHIAYQIAGEGPIDFVWQFDFTGDVDLVWEEPVLGPWLRDFASFARLILHDRRGIGLSSRNVPPPNLETRVGDLRAVLEEVGSERPSSPATKREERRTSCSPRPIRTVSVPSSGSTPCRASCGRRTSRGGSGPTTSRPMRGPSSSGG